MLKKVRSEQDKARKEFADEIDLVCHSSRKLSCRNTVLQRFKKVRSEQDKARKEFADGIDLVGHSSHKSIAVNEG